MSFLPTTAAEVRPFDKSATTVLDSVGNATLKLGPVGDVGWGVALITLEGTGQAQPVVKVYQGDPLLGRAVDGTSAGLLDAGDYNPPIPVPPGEYLTFVWSAGTPNSNVGVRLSGLVAPRA